jgi:FkbM family methyltransferase
MQTGSVVAFEPSPLEFEKLQTTIEWNSLDNVTAECIAISDHEGEVQFSESLDGLGVLNKIGAPAKPQNRNRQIAVKCMSLDAYFSTSVLRPDFIKIDVERHEMAVLSGAKSIIQQHRPVFMIEMMWGNGDEASGPEAIWEFLSEQNYQWFGLTEHGQSVDQIFEKPLTRDDLAHRRSVIKNHAYPSRNMYAIPSEKTALMKA